MKKTALLILMSFSVALISCKKDDDNNPSSSNMSTYTETVPGLWKVSYYYDKDKEETSNYSGYTFDFSNGGTLSAMLGSQTFQGSWNTTVDDNLPRLVISISGTNDLLKMSDNWVIKSMTSNEINLEDNNTTHIETLRFTKIN